MNFQLMTLHLIFQAIRVEYDDLTCDTYDTMIDKVDQWQAISSVLRNSRKYATAQIYQNCATRLRQYARSILFYNSKLDTMNYVISENHGIQAKNF